MKRVAATPRALARGTRSGVVRALPFEGDDHALVAAIRAGHPGAAHELYDRYAPLLSRILARVLGVDPELPDLLQEVYVRALKNIDQVDDPARLGAWLTTIAVFTARQTIRSRKRRRWLAIVPPESMPERSTHDDAEGRQLLRLTYELMDKLPTEERIAFALHCVEGLDVAAVAEAMGVSKSTAKRRSNRAQARFVRLASRVPALRARIEGGGRWSAK